MKNYFEGWYFKHQTPKHTFVFIPGMSVDEKNNWEAFIQIIMENNSYFLPFPAEDYFADRKKLYIRVANNIFSASGAKVDIQMPEISLSGILEYGPMTVPSSDVMGPFRWAPFMECRHGVISARHEVGGRLKFNGDEIDFCQGVGYIETDRGISFPRSYVWVQCNRFRTRDGALMLSVADIPWMGSFFRGTIALLFIDGKEYRLATYCGAKVTHESEKLVVVEQNGSRLEIKPMVSDSYRLMAPARGKMNQKILECPSCMIEVTFSVSGKILFDDVGLGAGFEQWNSGKKEDMRTL